MSRDSGVHHPKIKAVRSKAGSQCDLNIFFVHHNMKIFVCSEQVLMPIRHLLATCQLLLTLSIACILLFLAYVYPTALWVIVFANWMARKGGS